MLFCLNEFNIDLQVEVCDATMFDDVMLATKNYFNSNSQGFNPVCFLKAVEKWEIEE